MATCSAFQAGPVHSRWSTSIASDAALDPAAAENIPGDEGSGEGDVAAAVVPVAPAAPTTYTPPDYSGVFCRGYVGGEGPEPMLMPGFGTSVNFDPLGFTERSPEWVPWYREAELKHGRAAMLACAGMWVPELFRMPGEQFSVQNVPTVIQAHDKLPDSMVQIILWCSILEACSFGALANMDGFDRQPGDFGFDPLQLYPKDEAGQRERQLQELKNGRLAMIAIGGMVAQSAITGHNFPYV